MNRKGFTLIELMVVIAIIIILAAIAIPNYMNMQERAKKSRVGSDMAAVALALESYKTDWGAYPITTTAVAVNLKTGVPYLELSGTDSATPRTAVNNDLAFTSAGDKGGIAYVKPTILENIVNPWFSDQSIMYLSADGSTWTLYAADKGPASSPSEYLVRTDANSTVTPSTTKPTA